MSRFLPLRSGALVPMLLLTGVVEWMSMSLDKSALVIATLLAPVLAAVVTLPGRAFRERRRVLRSISMNLRIQVEDDDK